MLLLVLGEAKSLVSTAQAWVKCRCVEESAPAGADAAADLQRSV